MKSNELGREVEGIIKRLLTEDLDLNQPYLIHLLQAQQNRSRQSVTTISRLTADLQQANDRIKQLEESRIKLLQIIQEHLKDDMDRLKEAK